MTFSINSSKCAVLVYNESKPAANRANRHWTIGSQVISEVDSYINLGVPCHVDYKLSRRANEVGIKLRRVYFSLVDCAFHDNGLTPITSKRVYDHIVLPKALFGTECLLNMTKSEILCVERAHRLCNA